MLCIIVQSHHRFPCNCCLHHPAGAAKSNKPVLFLASNILTCRAPQNSTSCPNPKYPKPQRHRFGQLQALLPKPRGTGGAWERYKERRGRTPGLGVRGSNSSRYIGFTIGVECGVLGPGFVGFIAWVVGFQGGVKESRMFSVCEDSWILSGRSSLSRRAISRLRMF